MFWLLNVFNSLEALSDNAPNLLYALFFYLLANIVLVFICLLFVAAFVGSSYILLVLMHFDAWAIAAVCAYLLLWAGALSLALQKQNPNY